MNKFPAIKLFFSIICISVLVASIFTSMPAQAQAPTSTPTPAPTPVTAFSDPNIVTFSQLQQDEIQLNGPFDSTSFSFALPSDWQLTAGTTLNLSLSVSFSTAQSQSTPVVLGSSGGTLTVLLNNVTLDVLQLNQVGDINIDIPAPLASFISTRSDGRMQLSFVLSAGLSCYGDQQTTIFIHKNSHFTLPHNLIKPDTSLVNFPRPIYQNSFEPDSAMLVVPDQPSAAELQATLTTAAGLGNLTGGALALDMTTLSNLTPEQAKVTNLIFVGKASSLSPVLAQLSLPAPIKEGKFQIAGGNPDDGFIQMVNSPWNPAYIVLVISGDTDQAIVKAAQALSTGVLRPNGPSNLAVVQLVQTASTSTSRVTDQTLADLGSTGSSFRGRGVNSASFYFNIPSGFTVTPDAYFDLVFGNSALLNYDRSGIVVSINNHPIGSVRLSDTTADESSNHMKITVPLSVLVPGNNRLEINALIAPNDNCTPPNMNGLWINIWPESTLHLPLTPSTTDPAASYDLSSFPSFFSYNPTLNDTAFVVSHNDLSSWRHALQLAVYLGRDAGGTLTTLSAFYADEFPEADRSNYNLLIIGHPSQLSIVSQINNKLPAPFLNNTDVAQQGNFQVTYLISPDSPLGYVEMIPSPWNADKVILTVLGNTLQGVTWAATSLLDSTLSWQVTGNFAIINNRQIISTDTRLTSVADIAPTQISGGVSQPPAISPALPFAPSQNGWILPALGISVVLIILTLVILAARSWSRNPTRVQLQGGAQHTNRPKSLQGIKKWFAARQEKSSKNRKT